MSLNDSGVAIDPKTKTVLLIGHDVIDMLVKDTNARTPADFNSIAKAIVEQIGASYNAYLDGVTDHQWALGSPTGADFEYLTSFLDPDTDFEFVAFTNDEPITPNAGTKRCLH